MKLKYTPILESASRILISTWCCCTQEEINFWQRLRFALRDRGFELILILYSKPPNFIDVPFLRVPYGLDMIPTIDRNFGLRHWLSNKDHVLDVDQLLKREVSWWGLETGTTAQTIRNQTFNLWNLLYSEDERETRVSSLYFYKDLYSYILKLVQPKLTLIWNGQHTQELILTDLCHKCNCPVAYIERAPFKGNIQIDNKGILADSSIGRIQDWHWSSEEEKNHWHSVMMAIVKNYKLKLQTWYDQPQSVGANNLKQRLNIPDDKKIILFAGQVDQDTQTFLFSPHFKNNLEAFKWFFESTLEIENIYILGKHHPRSLSSVDDYRTIVANRGVWLDDASLEDCLAIADRVVAVNSTVIYESLLVGKPALMLGKSMLSGKEIVYEVDNLKTAKETISRWLAATDFQIRKERWLDFGAYLLSSVFYTMKAPEDSEGQRDTTDLAKYIISDLVGQNCINYDKLEIGSSLVDLPNFCANLQQEIWNLKQEIWNLKLEIAAMERSFFWKLRNKWFELKQFFGLTTEK